MSKQEDANLILKLYELRREEKMRAARDWFVLDFHPQSAQDVVSAVMGDTSAYYRMVVSYWDMAATLVNHGAIDAAMFDEANGEHFMVFSRIQPFLTELRTTFGNPRAMHNLEKLVLGAPESKERLHMMRETSKRIAAGRAQQKSQTASS